MPTAPLRPGRRGTIVALLALLLIPIGAPSAQAQDAYRYWTYWSGNADGTWTYSDIGANANVVSDGDVEGWFFQTTAEATPSKQPGAAADFAALCPDGEPVPGQVRAGVVIDFGVPADSPEGDEIPAGDNPLTACVTVPAGSNGEQALAAAAEFRTGEFGEVCGIAGYPSTACADVVPAPAEGADAAITDAAADPEPVSQFPVWPIVAGLMVLSAIIVLLVARGKGRSTE